MSEMNASNRVDSHRARKKPRRRNRRRLVVLFGLCLLLLFAGAAGALLWKVDDAIELASSDTLNGVNTLIEQTDSSYQQEKPLSIVILGRDTRPETGSLNTDVMIVTVVNPKTKKVTMVSLPRDTRVKIPGYSNYQKINAVYSNGEHERRMAEANGRVPEENGVTLTKKTLKELLGIPVQYYVEVDFDGFKSIIDELGGIEVNVDRRMVYDDPTDDTHIDLRPGLQVLNGEQALGYVRHRHDNRGPKYYSSDFDRNRRQQEVIKAIVDKMTSFDGLPKVLKLIDVGAQYVRTDLSPEQIKGLAKDFMGINSSAITSLETDAYWKEPYTYLPKEKLAEIRTTLQNEMELSAELVAELNNNVVNRNSGVETASSGTPRKKKTQESAAPASKPVQEKPAQPQPEQSQQPGAQPPDPQPAEGTGEGQVPGETAPPPDLTTPAAPPLKPEQPPVQEQPGTTPPPDIVEQIPAPADSSGSGEQG